MSILYGLSAFCQPPIFWGRLVMSPTFPCPPPPNRRPASGQGHHEGRTGQTRRLRHTLPRGVFRPPPAGGGTLGGGYLSRGPQAARPQVGAPKAALMGGGAPPQGRPNTAEQAGQTTDTARTQGRPLAAVYLDPCGRDRGGGIWRGGALTAFGWPENPFWPRRHDAAAAPTPARQGRTQGGARGAKIG